MEESNNKDKIIYVPVEDILPNRFQPRLAFDEKELNELANSILKYGVIQPIVLRSIGDKYEIIAGERRYKASCLAGLKKVPAILNNTDDNTSAEIALLENLQRKNLTVIEEAQSYKKLMDRGFTQEDMASKLGVSQSSIANKMRLLNLPKEVQDALLYNRISERHARTLLSLGNEDLQKNLLSRIISEKLTVKQTEEEVSMILNREKDKEKEIPDNIRKFLNPEPTPIPKEELIGNKEVEEFLDIKVPEVVNIEIPKEDIRLDEHEESSEMISPFQMGDGSNTPNTVIERLPISNVTPFEVSEAPREEIKEEIESIEAAPTVPVQTYQQELPKDEVEEDYYEKDSLLNEYGEVNLPKVINRVRDFVNSLDEVSNLIETAEVDLPDKYQIIIEIDKNTPM